MWLDGIHDCKEDVDGHAEELKEVVLLVSVGDAALGDHDSPAMTRYAVARNSIRAQVRQAYDAWSSSNY